MIARERAVSGGGFRQLVPLLEERQMTGHGGLCGLFSNEGDQRMKEQRQALQDAADKPSKPPVVRRQRKAIDPFQELLSGDPDDPLVMGWEHMLDSRGWR
jgi:hypothetical protein